MIALNFYGLYKTDRVMHLLVSGCTHIECAVPEVRDFTFGAPLTDSVVQAIIREIDKDGDEVLDIRGGDAFEAENIQDMIAVLRQVKKARPNLKVVVLSKHRFEDIVVMRGGIKLLKFIDLLISQSGLTTGRRVVDVKSFFVAEEEPIMLGALG